MASIWFLFFVYNNVVTSVAQHNVTGSDCSGR